MTQITEEQLAALERLCEGATAGPWAVRPCEHDDWGWVRSVNIMEHGGETPLVAIGRSGGVIYDADEHRKNHTDPYAANAAFIAAAREALPQLVAEVRAQREEMARLRWERDVLAGSHPNYRIFRSDIGDWCWRSMGTHRYADVHFKTAGDALADLRRHLGSEGKV